MCRHVGMHTKDSSLTHTIIVQVLVIAIIGWHPVAYRCVTLSRAISNETTEPLPMNEYREILGGFSDLKPFLLRL